MKTLDKLDEPEFVMFKFFLRHRDVLEGLEPIPKRPLRRTGRGRVARLMVHRYSCDQAQHIMVEVLHKIHRSDLVAQRFPYSYQGTL